MIKWLNLDGLLVWEVVPTVVVITIIRMQSYEDVIGLYQWKVLPMSMKALGAVFQRLMGQILGYLQP